MQSFSHTAQFYETESFLSSAVTEYLAAGMESNEPVVVIASAPRRDMFVSGLRTIGIDTARAADEGRLMLLDARDTLTRFMRGSRPDQRVFADVVGDVIATAESTSGRSVRAYGEMVDFLWKDGNREGAIALERMWNDLSSTHSFSLMCAYEMGNFHSESDGADFRRICSHHSSVVPTERFTKADDAAKHLEVSLLQQRARALEAEIAHRKELDLQLRESLAERDRLLERERVARLEAESASRAKSEFLGVMSHELRTPLNAIAGHVQLVQMGLHGPVTPAQREALSRVEKSQRHLLSLINDILNLVRIETARVEYRLTAVALAPLLREVASLIEPLIDMNRLEWSVSIEIPASVTVRADGEKTQQIILNLLSNSLKFTPAGGSMSLEASADETSATIRVRDTGVGIPGDKLDDIFEPFVQLGVRPLSGLEGLGLGLAISHDLARGMRGELTVESEVGVGTAFTLILPRS